MAIKNIRNSASTRGLQRRFVRDGSPRIAYFEALESRQLLAGDYGLVINTMTLPSHTVSGFLSRGTAKVTLTNVSNAGFTLGDRADIRLIAHPVNALDSTTDIELGKMLNQAVGIAIGKSKSFMLQLTLPANAPIGAFDVIAVATPTAGGADLASVTTPSALNVDAPVLDFATTLGTVTLPATALSGSTATGSVQVKITNNGNITSPANETVDITIGGIPAVLVGTPELKSMTGVAVGNIKPGKFKLVTVKFNFPITLSTDTYAIQATVSNASTTAESTTANNSAISVKTVPITQGVFDLAASFGAGPIPSAVITGGAGYNNIPVIITNNGNLTMSPTQKVKVELFARPTAGGSDQLLSTVSNIAVPNLAHAKTKSVTVRAYPVSFLAGTYNLVAKVTPETGTDTNSANNEAVSATTVTAAGPFFDLIVDSGTETFAPTVAGGASGTVNVMVKNIGNSISSAGYTVEVFATENGTIPGGAVPVGTFTTSTVKINAGASVKVPVKVALGEPVATSAFILVARVTRSGESTSANNEGNVGTVTVNATPALLGLLRTTYGFVQTHNTPAGPLLTTGGTLTDGLGNDITDGSGYSYVVFTGPGAILPHIQFHTVGGTTAIYLKFNGTRPLSIDGKVIVFQRSKTDTSGSFTAVANLAAGIPNEVKGYFKLV